MKNTSGTIRNQSGDCLLTSLVLIKKITNNRPSTAGLIVLLVPLPMPSSFDSGPGVKEIVVHLTWQVLVRFLRFFTGPSLRGLLWIQCHLYDLQVAQGPAFHLQIPLVFTYVTTCGGALGCDVDSGGISDGYFFFRESSLLPCSSGGSVGAWHTSAQRSGIRWWCCRRRPWEYYWETLKTVSFGKYLLLRLPKHGIAVVGRATALFDVFLLENENAELFSPPGNCVAKLGAGDSDIGNDDAGLTPFNRCLSRRKA